MRRGAGHKDGRGGGGGTLRSLGFFRGSVQTASAVLHRVGRGFIGRSRARNLRMERARLRLHSTFLSLGGHSRHDRRALASVTSR